MKAKMGFMVAATVFLFGWTTADLVSADPPNFNDLFDECTGDACGAPPSGGVGGGGAGGGPLIVSYTWGPVFSVQEDIDADGYNDANDNCMFTPNDPSLNADGDEFGDACDLCPNTISITNTNIDADLEIAAWQEANPGVDLADMPKSVLIGDACDDDMDGDGIPNTTDNCTEVRNADQLDSDGDGIGDACDEDSDNDGVPNILDNCITDVNPSQANDDFYIDGDRLGNACDDDYDNDGLTEASGGGYGEDRCPNLQSPENGDLDGDGVDDPCDNCPNIENSDQTDTNGNGRGDACDV
jgi:hypothetical protein